ncbi:8474_t:CDS:2 [Cetraspora pellucida]|uniref:8474_t:CDS:1 n=1 Tax=Cetraspora pellucida TaxID=1433469 RepID=A0A9N8VJI8_9GLOM|nr:8474_t:CDS:2 [Cetraspora pellucida]
MLLKLSQPETYDELLPKLLQAMCKICQSHIVQEKESKSDEYTSEFERVNDATINALRWKADKPSDFAIKGNSKHIFESLEWYTDVPISVKDKDDKIVTATGNFAYINNSEPEPMLCLGMTWIRKVQGILDPNKNQFRIKLHGKTYTIPTFSKATEVNEPEQQVSDMYDGKVLAERCSQLTEAKTAYRS